MRPPGNQVLVSAITLPLASMNMCCCGHSSSPSLSAWVSPTTQQVFMPVLSGPVNRPQILVPPVGVCGLSKEIGAIKIKHSVLETAGSGGKMKQIWVCSFKCGGSGRTSVKRPEASTFPVLHSALYKTFTGSTNKISKAPCRCATALRTNVTKKWTRPNQASN